MAQIWQQYGCLCGGLIHQISTMKAGNGVSQMPSVVGNANPAPLWKLKRAIYGQILASTRRFCCTCITWGHSSRKIISNFNVLKRKTTSLQWSEIEAILAARNPE